MTTVRLRYDRKSQTFAVNDFSIDPDRVEFMNLGNLGRNADVHQGSRATCEIHRFVTLGMTKYHKARNSGKTHHQRYMYGRMRGTNNQLIQRKIVEKCEAVAPAMIC